MIAYLGFSALVGILMLLVRKATTDEMKSGMAATTAGVTASGA
jgi:hypothetical protein